MINYLYSQNSLYINTYLSHPLVAQTVKRLLQCGRPRSGLGRSPGGGKGSPLQYSCLENSMDGGALWATVHGVKRVGHGWATSLSFFANLCWFIWRIFVVLPCVYTKSLQYSSTLCDLWSVVCQAPLPTGFSRQGYWSGFLLPSPGVAPDAGIEPTTLMSPGLAGRFLTTSITWEAHTLDYAQFFELSKNRTKIMFSRSP